MPELVEKKDPPIITSIRNTKDKFGELSLREKPIFVTLLVIDKNSLLKLLSKFKNTKNIKSNIRK
tara:strand:- start:324 stop:518 length:195 start_codon:yes stop_codon:yes gene_type:complete